MEPADEQVWIEQAKQGQEAGFGRLVAEYQKKVYAFILGMVRDSSTADELTQTTFLKAWKSVRQFRGESAFQTWLFQIAFNTVRSWGRWQKLRFLRERPLESPATVEGEETLSVAERYQDVRADADPTRPSEAKEMNERLQAAIGKLPPQEKSVFMMRHLQDISTKDVAVIMGIAEGSVKAHLFHALEKLRKALEE